MNTTLPCLLAAALAAGTVHAQATDVGLTMDGGMLTVIFGQDCGPVTCAPFVASGVGINQPRVLVHYSAPQSLYVMALGLPGPCVAIPGFDNVLLLDTPVVIDWGITSSPPFVPLPCPQGIANFALVIPTGVPLGITFRVQSLGFSNGGQLAFSPAIEATTV